VVSAAAAACSASVSMLLLRILHADGATVGAAARVLLPALLVDVLLALVVVPVIRWFLRNPSLRLERVQLPVLPGASR
jgi:hypothetical protein